MKRSIVVRLYWELLWAKSLRSHSLNQQSMLSIRQCAKGQSTLKMKSLNLKRKHVNVAYFMREPMGKIWFTYSHFRSPLLCIAAYSSLYAFISVSHACLLGVINTVLVSWEACIKVGNVMPLLESHEIAWNKWSHGAHTDKWVRISERWGQGTCTATQFLYSSTH